MSQNIKLSCAQVVEIYLDLDQDGDDNNEWEKLVHDIFSVSKDFFKIGRKECQKVPVCVWG